MRRLDGLSLLVVDDHTESLKSLVELLRSAGAIVVGVRTPKAAMGYAPAARFDAVLVDLPTDDGSWLLRALRESPTPSIATPVFAIIGERHDRRHGEDGFAGHFLKPIDRDTLVATFAGLPRRSVL